MSATARQRPRARRWTCSASKWPILCRDSHALLLGVLVRDSGKGRALLELLGRLSGGWMFDAAGSAVAQSDLTAWLAAGLPTPEKIAKIEVEGAQAEDLYFPAAWIPGRTLHVFGRLAARDHLRLSLTSLHNGKPVTQQWKLAVAPNQDDVFVGRLWAQRKLDQLRSTQPVAQEASARY